MEWTLQQLDHVKHAAEPDSPEDRQADQVIQRIQQQSAGSGEPREDDA